MWLSYLNGRTRPLLHSTLMTTWCSSSNAALTEQSDWCIRQESVKVCSWTAREFPLTPPSLPLIPHFPLPNQSLTWSLPPIPLPHTSSLQKWLVGMAVKYATMQGWALDHVLRVIWRQFCCWQFLWLSPSTPGNFVISFSLCLNWFSGSVCHLVFLDTQFQEIVIYSTPSHFEHKYRQIVFLAVCFYVAF